MKKTLLFCLLFLFACGGEDVYTIGVVVPLSGEVASLGTNALAGIELAVQDAGKPARLVVEDSGCGPDAVHAFTKLILVDDVDAILGPVCSAAAGPALPIAVAHDVPVMMIGASAPELTLDRPTVFRVYPSDSFQGTVAADFLLETLQKKKVAIIYSKNAWGEGIQSVFADAFTAGGGTVLFTEGVLPGERDLRNVLLKAQQSGAEVLYFPVNADTAIVGFQQMQELGFSLQVVAGETVAADEVRESGTARNVIYSVSDVQQPDAFRDRLHQLSGYEDLSMNLLAPLGYDAATVVFHHLDDLSQLSQTDYAGVSNHIRFDTQGDLATASFSFYRLHGTTAEAFS